MSAGPAFLLAGPDGTLRAGGLGAAHPDPADARAALAAGTPMVVGALPFDVRGPAALFTPQWVERGSARPAPPSADLPAVRVTATVPDPAEHGRRVAAAVRRLNDPAGGLEKVVLARALQLSADAPLPVPAVLGRLAADTAATVYRVDLDAAGADWRGVTLVGASPELLVARTGATVTARPFAGSAPRHADPDADAAAGAALAASAKDRHEHRLVVEALRTALQPWCTDVRIADEPALSATAAVWHLSTPVTARLRTPETTALDLALALHPTPAVGGVPAATAAELIADLEGDRGFYAGAVGWCDATGDGRFVVTVRCAEIAPDRRTVLARAGGGIVAQSDPDAEVAETTAKFATILTALGVPR